MMNSAPKHMCYIYQAVTSRVESQFAHLYECLQVAPFSWMHIKMSRKQSADGIYKSHKKECSGKSNVH